MEERKRKILEEVEFVIHASSIYNDFLNIFTSGSYSNWWLYCDSLTEEEVIAEIKNCILCLRENPRKFILCNLGLC